MSKDENWTPGVEPAPTPSTPDRVFVAGDWHGNVAWGIALIRHARSLGIDVLLQLGDFGIWDRCGTPCYLNDLEHQADLFGVTVYAIGGNHENYDEVCFFELHRDPDGFVTLRPHVRWIPRGHRWAWSGVTFGALGGGFSVDWRSRFPGKSWWPGQEELGEDDIERLGDAPLDVLLTHDAPAGMEPKIGSFEVLPPRTAEAAWRTRWLVLMAMRATHPRLVLHGHWHVRQSRHETDDDGTEYLVEGLASDQEANSSAWGVLELPSLAFRGGDEISRKFSRLRR